MVELSSLDVRALIHELREFEDAYIDKAYQTGDSEVVLKVRRAQKGAVFVVFRLGEYAAKLEEAPTTPERPSNFAMALRKHLIGARIRRIDQHAFDRVMRIQLERAGEVLEVVIELFGKGNLILVGADHKIILVFRSEVYASRTLKRGELLVFPPARANPLVLTRSEFEALAAASEKDLVRFLALDLGLGGDLSEEVVHRAGGKKSAKARDVDAPGLERLFSALRSLVDAPPAPAILSTARGTQITSLDYTSPVFKDARREPMASLSEAIRRVAAAEFDAKPVAPDQALVKLRRRIEHQEKAISDLESEATQWERRGHLLFAHYPLASQLLQKARAAIKAQGWAETARRHKADGADEGSWLERVAEVDPKRARVVVRLEEESLPLDPEASLEANATLLYDEAKRIRAKAQGARKAIADARAELAKAEAAPAHAAKPGKKKAAPGKRFWFEGHRWFFSSEGFLVVAGRDAGSNEKLVKRHLSTGDRYVHADFHGAPSCVVKCEGKAPGPATMREACQFGVTNSKAFSQFATADAYWVLPEQVSKTAESGEYVAKGSFIVRGTRHYESKLPLETALALVTLDANGKPSPTGPNRKLMSGPPSAAQHWNAKTVRIVRGDQKPTELAKKLAPELGVTLDEVVAALPPGLVRVAPPAGAAA